MRWWKNAQGGGGVGGNSHGSERLDIGIPNPIVKRRKVCGDYNFRVRERQ